MPHKSLKLKALFCVWIFHYSEYVGGEYLRLVTVIKVNLVPA